MRRLAQGDSQKIQALLSPAKNAEKRSVVTKNQHIKHEEKIMTLNQKTSIADDKWDGMQVALRGATKRARQGSQERILEPENQIKYVITAVSFTAFSLVTDLVVAVGRGLERQNKNVQKRNVQLGSVKENTTTGGGEWMMRCSAISFFDG